MLIDKKCRVILLNPPTAATSNVILLNLAYLSSVLKSGGHEVKVIDATAPYNSLNEEQVHQEISEFKPDFIGITLTITYIPQTYKFIQRLRKLGIPIVAGGPHANCLPEEVLNNGVDIVAIGESEETILELAAYFRGNKKLEEILGICYKDENNSFCYTKPRPLIQNLDVVPFPDYDSFPINYYTGNSDPNSNPIFWGVFTSRGCPYNCTFCSSHNVFGRTFRARSPENVFKEIESLVKKYGAKFFAFQDDEAFIDKKRIINFCNLIKKSKLNHLVFSARLRIDSLDEQMLEMMSSIGFRRLAFGIESFNDETLFKINKKYTSNQVENGLELLAKLNLFVIHFNTIIGFPWETPSHLESNLKKISKIDHFLKFFASSATPTPYPKTKLYEDYHEQYGFTNWWLSPEKNSPKPKLNTFFSLFFSLLAPLYIKDIFWDHSAKMVKSIEKFSWSLGMMNSKQCFKFPLYNMIYLFSRISHYVWKINPKLERIIFFPWYYLAKSFKLNKKSMFIYQNAPVKKSK